MRSLSGKERLLRVFRQQPTDRVPFWLWDVDPMFPLDRPSWKPLYGWVEKYELDIMRWWHPKFESALGPPSHPGGKLQSSKSNMWEYKNVIDTPIGDLTQVYDHLHDIGNIAHPTSATRRSRIAWLIKNALTSLHKEDLEACREAVRKIAICAAESEE